MHTMAIIGAVAAGLLVLRCAWVGTHALVKLANSSAILAAINCAYAEASDEALIREASYQVYGEITGLPVEAIREAKEATRNEEAK